MGLSDPPDGRPVNRLIELLEAHQNAKSTFLNGLLCTLTGEEQAEANVMAAAAYYRSIGKARVADALEAALERATPRKVGRPSTVWGGSERYRLMQDFIELVQSTRIKSISRICELLSKREPWKSKLDENGKGLTGNALRQQVIKVANDMDIDAGEFMNTLLRKGADS
jgi:hypothetical protein